MWVRVVAGGCETSECTVGQSETGSREEDSRQEERVIAVMGGHGILVTLNWITTSQLTVFIVLLSK